jgi:hypothetical protein
MSKLEMISWQHPTGKIESNRRASDMLCSVKEARTLVLVVALSHQ